MAKERYKIPYSIKMTKLDIPLSMKKGSVGLNNTIPLKVLLLVFAVMFAAVVITMWMIREEFGFLALAMTLLGLLLFSGLAIMPQKNGLLGFKWFIPTIAYWVSFKSRYINTRGSARASEVENLKWQIPVESWDMDSGVIYYTDNSVGMVFEVVGFGSKAMFQDEMNRVIDAYDGYLRSIEQGTYLTIIPKQTTQDVSKQVESLHRLREAGVSPSVDAMISRKIQVLETYVAKAFKANTIMVSLRVRNPEQLADEEQNILRGVGSVFRQVRSIHGDELVDFLAETYRLS